MFDRLLDEEFWLDIYQMIFDYNNNLSIKLPERS